MGFVKINVDGALFHDTKRSGIGVIMRDCEGEVVMARCVHLVGLYTPEETEALAIKIGCKCAQEEGIDKFILESDAQVIVNYLNKSGELLSSVGVIIIGIKDLLRGFTDGRVQHVPRMGNQAAQTLAQHAKGYHDNCSWRNETPMFLQATLNNDIRLMQSTA